jgi:hypothetical protein
VSTFTRRSTGHFPCLTADVALREGGDAK